MYFEQENVCCYKLSKALKTNYSPIGLVQNNPLPQWLHYQIVDGIIHIWGIPQENDDPKIYIRVIDKFQFVILSFSIIIESKQNSIDEQQGDNINNKCQSSKTKNNEEILKKEAVQKNQLQPSMIRERGNSCRSFQALQYLHNIPKQKNVKQKVTQSILSLKSPQSVSNFNSHNMNKIDKTKNNENFNDIVSSISVELEDMNEHEKQLELPKVGHQELIDFNHLEDSEMKSSFSPEPKIDQKRSFSFMKDNNYFKTLNQLQKNQSQLSTQQQSS